MNTILRALFFWTRHLFQPVLVPVRIERPRNNYFAHPGMKSR
jgi:hypothetical protein